jgi:hypothetical protein
MKKKRERQKLQDKWNLFVIILFSAINLPWQWLFLLRTRLTRAVLLVPFLEKWGTPISKHPIYDSNGFQHFEQSEVKSPMCFIISNLICTKIDRQIICIWNNGHRKLQFRSIETSLIWFEKLSKSSFHFHWISSLKSLGLSVMYMY